MRMVEEKIHADPRSYEARNIFGSLSKRQFISAVAIAALILPAVVINFRLGLPGLSPVTMAAFVPCIAIGVFLTAPVHGLHAERWLPIVLADLRTPKVLIRRQKVVTLTRVEGRPRASERRAERRRLKAEARARATETEGR